MNDVAVVLAGGLGTRLRAVTLDRWPKPMTPVAFRDREYPFLAFPLAHLLRCGITDVILCIGHLGAQIQAYFGDGSRYGLNIRYDDGGPVQTATRVWRALRLVDAQQALVLCGDVYNPLDLTHFMASFDARASWMLQLAVRRGQAWQSNTAWGTDHGVTAFGESGISGERVGRESGVLAVRRAAFCGLDAAADLSLTDDVYPHLMQRKALGVVLHDTDFIDIGNPADLERFRRFVNAGHAMPLRQVV